MLFRSRTLRLYVDDGFGGRDTVRFSLVVNDNSLPVLSPINDVQLNEGDSVTVALTATDAEMTSNIEWAFNNMPSWATFTNNGNGSGSLKFKPSYAHSGLYQMTVVVDDGFGAWTERTFNIVVNEADPNESIQINMRYFTGNVPLWNDVNIGTNFNRGALVNKKGEVTTVGFRMLSGGTVSGSEAGEQPGGLGLFPDIILKDQLQIGHNGGSDVAQLQVYGLNPNKKYNFIFFASTNAGAAAAEPWRGFNANSATTFSINGNTAQAKMLGNINQTDTIYQIQPNASGQINITMTGDPSPGIGALLNALVVDAQFDDGTPPAKPENLNAQVIPNVGVRLTWNDVAYNENSYRVFRSTNVAGPYTALTPDAPRDTANYVDGTVAPYTQYYYYVRGINNAQPGISSDTVSAITGNNKPTINNLSNLYVKSAATGNEDFSISDNPEDVITVSIRNKPAFVTLSSLGGNNYRIAAAPTVDNIGFHYLTVEARDDKGGLQTQEILVQVADQNTRSFYINLAYRIAAPAPWNNHMGYANGNATVPNLRDETNTVTPYSVTFVENWDDITVRGQRTGNNTGIFPDSVLAGGIVHYNTNNLTIRFNGLNNAMRYNVMLVGSHNEGFSSIARFSTTGSADTLQIRNNTNSSANLNGLTPVGGVITLTVNRLTGTYIVLNGIQLEEYAPAVTFMNPINLSVEGRTNGTSVTLNWSDRSNNEIGFQIQRATDSLFTQSVSTSTTFGGIATLSSSGVTQNLAANTRYWYRVRAIGPGGTFSAYSNRVRYITPGNIINVNFNFSVEDQASWNNLGALPNFTNTFAGLLNSSNQPSGMILSIEKIFNGEYAFGPRPGNGVVPDNVLQSSYWIDRGQLATMRLSGLNQSKRYRIGFMASVDNAIGFNGDMTMTYTINGRTVYLNGYFNTTKMVWIGDIVPDQNGEVLIEFSTPYRRGDEPQVVYGFSNGFIVHSYDDAIGGQVLNMVNNPDFGTEITLQTPGTVVPQAATEQPGAIDTRMYPNPFVDQINLDFNNTKAGNHIAVDVFDISGRLVYRRNYGKLPAGYNTLRLNTAEGGLNTGVYMVTLTVNGKPVQATKMIKDRK